MRSPMLDLLMLIGGLVSIAGSYSMMKNAKSKLSQGQVSREGLTNDEKNKAYIFAILNPIWAGIILYYGWRKYFPLKAKNANNISLTAFGLWLISSFLFGWPVELFASI